MKVILLSAALAVSVICTRAQQTDTAQLIVHYKFAHITDTTNRASPHRENMMLVIGRKAGVYRSYDRKLEYADLKKQTQEAIARSGGGGITVNQHFTASGDKYYQYPNEKKLVVKMSLLFSNFLISGALPVINWHIMGDTANFGGLHCQKATGHYKGRDYTAWFCPDLPIRVGPWELTGLPGVIVEAYDTKKEVCFMFNGVEKAGELDENAKPLPLPPGPGTDESDIDPNLIKLPKDVTKVTAKDFARLQETEQKDPAAFAQVVTAAAAQNGPAGDVKGPKIGFSSRSNGHRMNNPIELPEKQ